MTFEEFSKEYLNDLKKKIDLLDLVIGQNVVDLIVSAYNNGKQVFICGNGGSASTSSHFATDLGKGTVNEYNDKNEKRIKVMSLTDNLPLITAYGNDLSYSDIFSEQLCNFVDSGDVLIVVSASGNSPNIVKALELAKSKGAVTVGLCGFNGGKVKLLADYVVYVENDHYGIVEDCHHIFLHLIAYYVKKVKDK